MNINSVLKKEEIKNIKELDTFTVNQIAAKISRKLAETFAGQNLSKSTLFRQLSRLRMFTAEMPEDLSGAKYLYLNKAIYFRRDANFKDLEEFATHECIHYLQELKDTKGNVVRLGLYDFAENGTKGMAINEAAVQLMAATANKPESDNVKYYGITLNTISPNYYPLECSLLNEVAYFTGSYALYHSTLYSDNVFKNAVNSKLGQNAYKNIEEILYNLMQTQTSLNMLFNQLRVEKSEKKIKKLNSEIEKYKDEITNLYINGQNYIIRSGFNTEFNLVRTMDDLLNFKNRLYKFKDLIGYTADYDFYNNYYIQTMKKFEQKQEFIEEYGEITNQNIQKLNGALTVVEHKISFFKRILIKLGILTNVNQANLSEVMNNKNI